jgi:outer membrane lipoprotein LolB
MRGALRRAGAWFAALALAGCAAPPPSGELISGRLSLQVGAHADRAPQSLSAAFDLRGNAQSGELQLSAPFGATLAVARWSSDAATLITSDGERRFADLDGLSREALGEALPLRALPDWLRGRPWPEAPSRPLAPAAGFEQLGWVIDLAAFDRGTVRAQRAAPPALDLRVRLDSP